MWLLSLTSLYQADVDEFLGEGDADATSSPGRRCVTLSSSRVVESKCASLFMIRSDEKVDCEMWHALPFLDRYALSGGLIVSYHPRLLRQWPAASRWKVQHTEYDSWEEPMTPDSESLVEQDERSSVLRPAEKSKNTRMLPIKCFFKLPATCTRASGPAHSPARNNWGMDWWGQQHANAVRIAPHLCLQHDECCAAAEEQVSLRSKEDCYR